MSAELKILQALETRLAAYAADASLPVAFAGVRFERDPSSKSYLESQMLPASTLNPTLGDGFHRRPGLFQVTIVTESGNGLREALTIAGEVLDTFKRGLTLYHDSEVRVMVDETPSIGPVIPDGAELRLPITISYLADVFA